MRKLVFAFVFLACLLMPVSFAAESGDGLDPDLPSSAEQGGLGELVGVTYSSVAPVTPSDANGLKSLVLSLIGNYDPVVATYTYQSGNGYTNEIREFQPDYAWLCSAAIFLVVLYSVFRLWGVLFCRI